MCCQSSITNFGWKSPGKNTSGHLRRLGRNRNRNYFAFDCLLRLRVSHRFSFITATKYDNCASAAPTFLWCINVLLFRNTSQVLRLESANYLRFVDLRTHAERIRSFTRQPIMYRDNYAMNVLVYWQLVLRVLISRSLGYRWIIGSTDNDPHT